ncbi:hypothetical protein [Galbibacter mesophilus]|uniref:hypothetical protein n=1 Tax=Galbibacter mesophilus TaxID=379069 RepID=UPI00191DDC81|nr:hypothetical protein [Galbibacter mesophilus]MCM5664450.1 hypothetical protein [Galbibacter mesophilus]
MRKIYSCIILLFSIFHLQGQCLLVALADDLGSSSAEFKEIVSSSDGIATWEILRNAGSKYVKTNPKYLKTFNKLSPDVQALVAKFTDDGTRSTLTKFLDDCDDDFITMLNQQENLVYVKGMLAHKDQAFSVAEMEQIGELIDNTEANEKLSKWIIRSKKIDEFKTYTSLGRSLDQKIKLAITDKNSSLFKKLQDELGVDLSNYVVLTEVPLVTKNGFMKADIVLIRRSNDGFEDIEDVIIVENKLSQNTTFTPRQKEGFGAILNGQTQMKVKYDDKTKTLKSGQILTVSENKIYKIADHGADDISNITIEKIKTVK